ncbi:MAG: hypothetical protein COB83_13100 [Gammaproteobacteria bacterium]|nr:MAG: hypothetical protein COB83_13100 [Gammaproteobacteria bacterium]
MFQEHIIDCYKGLIMRCSANLLDDNYLNTSSFDSPICKWSYFMNAQLYGVIPEVIGLLDFSQRLRIFNKKNKMFYLPIIKHLNKTSLLAQIDDKQQFKLINILTTQSKRNGRKISLVTSYLDITNDNIRQKILNDLKIELTELETINSIYNTLFNKLMRFKYG